jgi:LPXTG-motif cell wall-anchored protein
MQNRLRGFAALLLALAVVLGQPAAPVLAQELEGEVLAEGFNGPQGVLVAPDGSVYVVDSGVGGDNEMEAVAPSGETVTVTYGDTARIVQVAPDGTQTEVAVLPSVFSGEEAIGGARAALVNDELYVTSGGWIDDGSTPPNVLPNTAAVLRVGADGSLEQVVPTWRMENRMNPDNAIKESHPYGIVGTADGKLLVADAGANTLIRIDPATGTVELVTTFPAIPGVFPNPDRGGEMLADPVPTGVDVDGDGNAYVSLLSGAPFVPGSAKVIKVTPAGARTDYATNLTMLTDLRFGPDGNIYAVQFGVFTDQGPTPNSGAIVRVLPGDRSVPVVTGLSFPTSVDFSEAGDAYVVINGVGAPGSGALVRYAGFTAAAEEAVNAAAPSVTVNDQESDGTSVTVASVKAPEDGWMVIHADANGSPGAILGQTAVPAGTTENVVVMLETPLESDATVWAMLHTDKGEAGVYEFPDGPDVPVSWNGAIVMAPLNVALTEGMASTPEAPEEPAPAAAAEATPEATEEAAEEAATPAATEEAVEEAATPEATEEAAEEAATPEATEEAMEEAAAPETLPRTGASEPSGVATLAVVVGIGALAAGSLLLRRRRA